MSMELAEELVVSKALFSDPEKLAQVGRVPGIAKHLSEFRGRVGSQSTYVNKHTALGEPGRFIKITELSLLKLSPVIYC